MLPLYISMIWSRDRASASDSIRRQGITRRRKRLREILPDEISEDSMVFEALDGVLSIEYWVSLRRDQRLSAARATRVVRMAVEKLTTHE